MNAHRCMCTVHMQRIFVAQFMTQLKMEDEIHETKKYTKEFRSHLNNVSFF